jgi:hypothetical protein
MHSFAWNILQHKKKMKGGNKTILAIEPQYEYEDMYNISQCRYEHHQKMTSWSSCPRTSVVPLSSPSAAALPFSFAASCCRFARISASWAAESRCFLFETFFSR